MLSVIITTLNEKPEILERTISSLSNSLDFNHNEIIVIDDNSNIPVKMQDNIILERNKFRIGVAQSRHLGACLASKKWLLFTDAHMIFEENWYKNFVEYQKQSTKNTVYCGTCLGLSSENQNIQNANGRYRGARLELWNEKENQILEGKWIPEKKDEDYYDISCLMGALYFIQKDYFFQLRGLSDLKMWGSDEPCLSLKTLLSGGEIKLLKNVQAGHIFRQNTPYYTNLKYLSYNKIRMARTILPGELGRLLISKLPQNINYFEAQKMITQENKIIEEYTNYYKSIFKIKFEDLCQKFNIEIPK